MARYPVVQRNCPYKTSLASMMDGDLCRICSRRVHDLAVMSEEQRQSFLDSCTDEICVSYTLPRRQKAVAVALSAALIALPAAAQEPAPIAGNAESEAVETTVAWEEEVTIVIGGIKDLSNIEYVDDAEDDATPELPVVYEDARK